MAARVVDGLSLSEWVSSKPKTYKGQDLDKALSAYASVSGTTLNVVTSQIPLPVAKISSIDEWTAKIKQASTVLEKTKADLKKIVDALKAVQTAANKTSADLSKAANAPNVDKDAYSAAATRASSVGSAAADALSRVQ
jgi:hypothetical protein